MKQITIKVLFGSVLFATVAGGCKKEWFDINKDPNNAVESNISPDLVAPAALLTVANRVTTGYGFVGNWMGYTAPGANYAPSTEEQGYQLTTNFGAGIFGNIMNNAYDFQFMDDKAAASKQTFYQGIAKVMKGLDFAEAVDVYNDVPYSEALKSLAVIRPKYDAGLAVYEGAMKQIDSGLLLIKNAVESENTNLSNADVMFHGDKTLWLKFANTLKLRLLMHQVNRADRAAYITAELAKITAEGSGFLGSGQDAAVNPGYQQDKPNAYYATFGFTQTGTPATDFWRGNVVALNYYKLNQDPRLGNFYKTTVNPVPAGSPEPFTQPAPTTYRGNQYGLPINNSTYPFQTANYVSQVGGISAAGTVSASSAGLIKGYNAKLWILTSVESLFLQAEAINRGLLPGDAKTAYMNAVKESFLWLNTGGSAAAATAAFNTWYGDQDAANNPDVSWDDATNKSRTLIFQKYLALNGIANVETWTDFRRYTAGAPQTDPDPAVYAAGKTGAGAYPYLDLSQNPGRTSAVIPMRLLYPQRELNLNEANVPQVGRKAGDQFTKIWWMP
jgi:SusD/RagB-like outer membrane lipoprotein